MAVTLAQRQGRVGPHRSKPTARLVVPPPIPMEKFVIEGGVPLSGTIVPAGNKNGALPILAACLLTDDEVVLRNVPAISDVDTMVAPARRVGRSCAVARPRRDLDRRLDGRLHRRRSRAGVPDQSLVPVGRAAPGPLRTRHMPPPGGDVIGRRRLDPHLDAFRALGASVRHNRDIELEADLGLRPCDFLMDEPSVMATENALMAAALTRGPTVIRNAASEPHVQDLARMLVAMGAPIDGIGSNVMTIHGTGSLRGCTHTIAPDHIEIGSFMALAGVTGGELIVKDTVPGDLRMIRLVFERLGLRSELRGADVIVPGNQRLIVRNDTGDYIPKVQDGPWPAFPADLTSVALALATQAEGSVMIHEWMFENRLNFTDKLVMMGAAITICDPHRAMIVGPRRLRGQRVDSPDIRAGIAMLLAALCADGIDRDRQHPPDRSRLRADRRAPTRARRPDRPRRRRRPGHGRRRWQRPVRAPGRPEPELRCQWLIGFQAGPATCCPTRCGSCGR